MTKPMPLGASGMKYPGEASSGPISRSPTQLRSSFPPKYSTLERARSGKPPSPRESGGESIRVERSNTTSCHVDREIGELHRGVSVQCDPWQRNPSQQPSQHPDSPKSILSLSDPSDDSTSCNPDDRDIQSAQVVPPTPTPRPSTLHILARVHLSRLLLSAIHLLRHLYLSSQEWAALRT